MRQTLLLIVGLIIGCTVQAKNRVIEEPPFCVRNTTSIEVSKIILSDTATILHIYAKYRPKTGYGLPRKVTCKTITEKLTYYAPA